MRSSSSNDHSKCLVFTNEFNQLFPNFLRQETAFNLTFLEIQNWARKIPIKRWIFYLQKLILGIKRKLSFGKCSSLNEHLKTTKKAKWFLIQDLLISNNAKKTVYCQRLAWLFEQKRLKYLTMKTFECKRTHPRLYLKQ